MKNPGYIIDRVNTHTYGHRLIDAK